MSLITPDDGPTSLTTSIDLLERQLADLRQGIVEISNKIQAGDLDQLKHATKATGEIRQWLRIAIEAEAQLEKRNKRDRGIVRDYALDLDDARAQIGCRLDRLRRARCPGGFPR